jgi:hypothetical protein
VRLVVIRVSGSIQKNACHLHQRALNKYMKIKGPRAAPRQLMRYLFSPHTSKEAAR